MADQGSQSQFWESGQEFARASENDFPSQDCNVSRQLLDVGTDGFAGWLPSEQADASTQIHFSDSQTFCDGVLDPENNEMIPHEDEKNILSKDGSSAAAEKELIDISFDADRLNDLPHHNPSFCGQLRLGDTTPASEQVWKFGNQRESPHPVADNADFEFDDFAPIYLDPADQCAGCFDWDSYSPISDAVQQPMGGLLMGNDRNLSQNDQEGTKPSAEMQVRNGPNEGLDSERNSARYPENWPLLLQRPDKRLVVHEEREYRIWVEERAAAFTAYQSLQEEKDSFGVFLANIVRQQLALKRAPRPGVMTRSAMHPAFKLKVPESDFLWNFRQLNFDPIQEDTFDLRESFVGRAMSKPSLQTFARYCFVANQATSRKALRPSQHGDVDWHKGRMYTFRAERGVPKEAVFLSDIHKVVDVSRDYEGRTYGSPWRFRGQMAGEAWSPGEHMLAYLPRHRHWNTSNLGQHNPATKGKANPPPPINPTERANDLLMDPLGRFYLDADGATIIDFPGLPLTIPSDVEDWRIVAMLADDQNVTLSDIMARMPHKGLFRFGAGQPENISSPLTADSASPSFVSRSLGSQPRQDSHRAKRRGH